MLDNKKIIKRWRGTRASYELIAKAKQLDYWTRYSVKDANGTWSEYYGSNLIVSPTGQMLPVLDIVEAMPENANPGDRYIIGSDNTGYNIVTFDVNMESSNGIFGRVEPIVNNSGISIRVINKGSKAYQLVDNELITYDEVNGGTY